MLRRCKKFKTDR